MQLPQLPITPHLEALVRAVKGAALTLLHATPGSGKTTLAPLALLESFDGKILVLEPRRLAAKLAALRLCQLTGTKLGELIGVQHRFEKKHSEHTRVIFLTEGSFLQYLRHNPRLHGVSVLVLDEFHERHLTTDLSFALTLPQILQGPTRLLVMSATLDEALLTRHVPGLAKLTVEAPVFPLTLTYPPDDVAWHKREWDKKVFWGINEALKLTGDVLVFLPGLFEIRRVRERLLELLDDSHQVLTLHSRESVGEDELMRPGAERRIILTSGIAESSLTIPGVRVVVDLGLSREARFIAWSGETELLTLPCAKAQAIQRAGRAAREAPGTCIRLYAQRDFDAREAFASAEIKKVSLSRVLLDLFSWDVDLASFAWPEAPSEEGLTLALNELEGLGAIAGQRLTPLGRLMQSVPLPTSLACAWALALQEADDEAFAEMCRLLARLAAEGAEAQDLRRQLHQRRPRAGTVHDISTLLVRALPDRICRLRAQDVITTQGKTFALAPEAHRSLDQRHPYWLVLKINPQSGKAQELLALQEADLRARASWRESEEFDEAKKMSVRVRRLVLGSLVLETQTLKTEASAEGHKRQALADWTRAFRTSDEYSRWRYFQAQLFPETSLEAFEWELFQEEFLLEVLHPDEATHRRFLQQLAQELQLYLDASFQTRLSDHAPREFALHPKRSVPVHYSLEAPPWIASHLQDFFGRSSTPKLSPSAPPLTLHLWGPHGRALQVTSDLAGFWERHYPSLRKELSRDYPRHFWPEDPRTAPPMLRKPR